MTRVLIVEDEHLAAQKLIRQLKNIDPELEIAGVIDSVDEAIKWLKNNASDLIFLDIHLGDDSSFKIFERIEVKTPIIFTTAYDQYAIQAFKLNSIDYLLKPINKKELQDALEKYHEHRPQKQEIDYQSLLMTLNPDQNTNYQKRFMVYKGDRVKTISVDSICYFFAEGKYVFLIAEDKKEYMIDYTLERLESLLNPDNFYRINRQFIINIEAIHEMISYTKGRLKIVLSPESKKDAIVSIERAADFKRWLNK